jgi:hypothetical protein
MLTTVLVIALVFVAFGTLFAAIGVGMRRGHNRFKARAATATGTVTDLRSRSAGDSGSGVVWVPVVKFTTADGRTVEAETSGGTNVKRHKPGQPIEVLYDPQQPADVRIPDWGSGLIHGVFIAMGSAFVLIGLAILAVAVAVT